MPRIPPSINGKEYPIAIDESGNLQWQTAQVAEERDEVWDDWSLGLGETKRETGRGYFFSRGWDASTRGALRLSPFYHNLNNTALTTAYGYFMEDVETSGATLALANASTGKADVTRGSSFNWSHNAGSQPDRLLVVGVSISGRIAPGSNYISVTYNNVSMTLLAEKQGDSGTVVTVFVFSLLAPAADTNTIRVSSDIPGSGTDAMVGGAKGFSNANQDTPFGTIVSATGTDGTPTITVTTAAGEQILAVVGVEGSATIAAGTNETERWDDTQAGSPSNDITGAGYTQAGSDGGVMAPSLTSGTDWVEIAVPIKPASPTSRSVMFVADTTKIFKYTYDADTGLTLDDTDTTASGVAGRPAKMNSKWYCPFGTGAEAVRLDDASTPTWADAGWEADHLANYQKGIQPTLARVNADTQNTVELNADTSGNVGDTWTDESEEVGDVSTKVTDLVEAQGLLFAAKEDGLYDWGLEAETRPIIPFMDRGKADSDNGKGTMAFGDMIFYPSKGNWWRYQIGRGALPVGANTIRSWRKISAISTPKTGRSAFGVYVEEYLYYLLNEGEVSHLIQCRLRREGDPEGHALIQHSVLTIPLSKGLGVDSRKRLWIKGASADETVRDIRVIQLADDGSLDVENRKGQADAEHNIYFDERNPGRPQDKVQIRHMTVELEGDWDATTSLQLKLWLDNSTTAISHGSAITSAGVTVTNPTTFGTSDTAFRFRPELALTTNSSYAPKNSDISVLRVIVGIRFPEIIKIVVNASPEALEAVGLDSFEAEQNLRRLQNQGTVTFRRPGDYDDPAAGTDLVTDRTFTGEVEGVTDIIYKTSEGYAHGLELRVRRWITY